MVEQKEERWKMPERLGWGSKHRPTSSLRPQRHQDEGGAGADRQARTDPGLGLPPGPGPAPSAQHRLLPTLRDTGGHVDGGKDRWQGMARGLSGTCVKARIPGPAQPPTDSASLLPDSPGHPPHRTAVTDRARSRQTSPGPGRAGALLGRGWGALTLRRRWRGSRPAPGTLWYFTAAPGWDSPRPARASARGVGCGVSQLHLPRPSSRCASEVGEGVGAAAVSCSWGRGDCADDWCRCVYACACVCENVWMHVTACAWVCSCECTLARAMGGPASEQCMKHGLDVGLGSSDMVTFDPETHRAPGQGRAVRGDRRRP